MSDKDLERLPESKERLEENYYPSSSGDGSNNSWSSDKEFVKQQYDEFERTLKNS